MARTIKEIPEVASFAVNASRWGSSGGDTVYGPYGRVNEATRMANKRGGDVVQYVLVPVEKMQRIRELLEDAGPRVRAAVDYVDDVMDLPSDEAYIAGLEVGEGALADAILFHLDSENL